MLLRITLLSLLILTLLTVLASTLGQSSMGQIAFISSRQGQYHLYLMDAERLLTYRLSQQPVASCCPSWSPDGKQISFQARNGIDNDVMILDIDSGQTRQITQGHGPNLTRVVWSPDEQHILLAPLQGINRPIYLMTPQGEGRRAVTLATYTSFTPAWTPDGQRITFVMYDGLQSDIKMIDADCLSRAEGCAANMRPFVANPTNDLWPVWSPDGHYLAYSTDHNGALQIHRIQAGGQDEQQLTHEFADHWMPIWSPDSQHIAYLFEQPGNTEIYVMAADGSQPRQLTHNALRETAIAWSPDGQRILFEVELRASTELFTVDVATGAERRLTNNRFIDSWAVWRPLPR